jgi:hypothetical protein
MFTATSRYYGLPVLTLPGPGGPASPPVRYVARRLLPDPDTLSQVGTYVTRPEDRLDLVANAQLGDPQQAWRIADAARVLDPDELTRAPGRVLRITLPAGITLPTGTAAAAGAGNG